MKHVTVIATSLSEDSSSQRLARVFLGLLNEAGASVELFDLRELDLPLAGPDAAWSAPGVAKLRTALERSSHVVFAVPIYCYDVNAAAKNVIELVGRALAGKVVSFLCTAGGPSSYMSVMGFANHLMLDFRSVIVPRFVYVQGADWADEQTLSPALDERLRLLWADMQAIHVATG